jgi:hypothetical protein
MLTASIKHPPFESVQVFMRFGQPFLHQWVSDHSVQDFLPELAANLGLNHCCLLLECFLSEVEHCDFDRTAVVRRDLNKQICLPRIIVVPFDFRVKCSFGINKKLFQVVEGKERAYWFFKSIDLNLKVFRSL